MKMSKDDYNDCLEEFKASLLPENKYENMPQMILQMGSVVKEVAGRLDIDPADKFLILLDLFSFYANEMKTKKVTSQEFDLNFFYGHFADWVNLVLPQNPEEVIGLIGALNGFYPDLFDSKPKDELLLQQIKQKVLSVVLSNPEILKACQVVMPEIAAEAMPGVSDADSVLFNLGINVPLKAKVYALLSKIMLTEENLGSKSYFEEFTDCIQNLLSDAGEAWDKFRAENLGIEDQRQVIKAALKLPGQSEDEIVTLKQRYEALLKPSDPALEKSWRDLFLKSKKYTGLQDQFRQLIAAEPHPLAEMAINKASIEELNAFSSMLLFGLSSPDGFLLKGFMAPVRENIFGGIKSTTSVQTLKFSEQEGAEFSDKVSISSTAASFLRVISDSLTLKAKQTAKDLLEPLSPKGAAVEQAELFAKLFGSGMTTKTWAKPEFKRALFLAIVSLGSAGVVGFTGPASAMITHVHSLSQYIKLFQSLAKIGEKAASPLVFDARRQSGMEEEAAKVWAATVGNGSGHAEQVWTEKQVFSFLTLIASHPDIVSQAVFESLGSAHSSGRSTGLPLGFRGDITDSSGEGTRSVSPISIGGAIGSQAAAAAAADKKPGTEVSNA